MGTFMSKENLLAEAERLGVTDKLEGLTWPQQQKVVLDARREESESNLNIADLPKQKNVNTMKKPVSRKYWLCIEMDSVPVQRIKYDEELGFDIETEDISFGLQDANQLSRTATYRTKNTNRKVFAQSTAPKENCGIYYDETKVTLVTTWHGREGYIYNDITFTGELGNLLVEKFGPGGNKFKGVKHLLIDTGYFGDYEKELCGPSSPYTWFAANKILSADMNKVESIMRDIENKYAKNKRLYGE